MREIEFRQLVNGTKIDSVGESVKSGRHYVAKVNTSEGKPFWHYFGIKEGSFSAPVRLDAESLKTVGQYAGLKDRNGRKIYEGDVVRLHCCGKDSASSRNGVIALIEWYEDGAGFMASIPRKTVKVKGGQLAGQEISMGEIHTWAGMHNCFDTDWGYMEVIGNVHENPELLKA